MKYYAIILFILLLLCGIGYAEWSMWDECLTDNSFFYCMRVLG